ncbi:hypothetical protein ACIBW9_10130 [Streptomyces sp. NPDC049541]|uniref:hypothetical protein n=1 Tax=Streptomyces sp. NPDC049541 TaxID=3365594 RepID=UPI0037BA6CFD
MRAFTTASWAFAGGADAIVLADSPAEARALEAGSPEYITLRDGPPAPGDAVDSPALVRSLDLAAHAGAEDHERYGRSAGRQGRPAG